MLYIILFILLLDFLVERTLAYLNASATKIVLPPLLENLYNPEEYAKQQRYFSTKQRFELYGSSVSLIVLLAMILLGGFSLVNDWANAFSENEIVISLFFFGVIYLGSTIISLPFDAYETFSIEERFGFNKSTKKLFVVDKIKELFFMALIGGLLLAVIQCIYVYLGEWFWLLAWGVMALFTIFLNMFYSQLIVPLFNKQTPLEAGELRDKIELFATTAGFKLDNIYVIDGSKRSTKANAYFSGLGPKKRVVLYDTLIADLTADEIVAVLAHEIGHYKNKHLLKRLFMSLLSTLVMFFLLGLALDSNALASVFGVEEAKFHINLLAFGLLYTLLSVAMGVISNYVSRRYEYQADAFASSYNMGEDLISGLKKLTVKSLSNLQPHPFYVKFYYSHPTLLQRIEAICKK